MSFAGLYMTDNKRYCCTLLRFSGALIILGGLSQVMTAVEEVVKFFRDELHFDVCEIHKS